MELTEAKAEFAAGRLNEVALEPSEVEEGWRLLLHSSSGETFVLTDHSGRERVFHSLDNATEIGRDIGFDSVRVEEHF